jgi:hypothetical protein
MTEENTIRLKGWHPLTHMLEVTGVQVGAGQIAQSLTAENFTRLLDDYLNLGGKGYPEGLLIGQNLRGSHRTLQRLAICFCFGIIVGLSEQQFTDPRNEIAIQTARKVRQMIEQGELPFGFYI